MLLTQELAQSLKNLPLKIALCLLTIPAEGTEMAQGVTKL